jgi:hypothetical protein
MLAATLKAANVIRLADGLRAAALMAASPIIVVTEDLFIEVARGSSPGDKRQVGSVASPRGQGTRPLQAPEPRVLCRTTMR